MNTWMLLERTDSVLPDIFRQIDIPDFVRLFDTTELAIYAEFSPLLVKDTDQGALLKAMQQAPSHWPGVVINSEHSVDALLQHLRHILLIRFEQSRKGLLRYWSPSVASYFFPACTPENLNLWLGPISRLSWHATLSAQGEARWQQLDNPHANRWAAVASSHPPMLGVEHEQALQQHRQHTIFSGQES